ncbi:MAG: transglutaminase TgpA family protein [Telluria sp.]
MKTKPLSALALRLTRDKSDTLLLLGAALMVLAPHALHLPLWVSLTCGATLLWRALITFRGTRMPASLVLLPLALAAMGGVFATFGTVLGRDAGVAMLVLLVAFKMLEMHARRDLFVVIFLCFFLVLTNFFYSQSIATALAMIASVVVLLTAQLSFQYTGAVPPLRRRVLTAAKIMALAAPLAVLLFFVFPRVQGPLWGLPGDATAGRSGMSDSMAPGNLSSLAMSDETAFRVRFDGRPPAQAELYWRGVVLGDFDGRTWRRVRATLHSSAAPIGISGRPSVYQVTLEPSSRNWVFALELPAALPALAGNPVSASPELELTADYPIEERVRYTVTSFLDHRLQAGTRLADRARWLALPYGFNPRAMHTGLSLQRMKDPARRVAYVLRMFATEQYVYTLEPPRLGRDSVDEFLFNTRAGFCEHYAGAFVFLMRAAGVPARVVTGYQGGQANPVDGYLTVRQSDAHAWAEVWLAGSGWQRVDPTAAVAPDRVQRGLTQSIAPRDTFAMNALGALIEFGAGENSLAARVRNYWDALNNGWNQWVLNYNPQRQKSLLERLQAVVSDPRVIGGLVLLSIVLLFGRAWHLRRQVDPIDALYSAMCLQLGRSGLPRAADEGPSAYAQRLSRAALPAAKMDAIARFMKLYSAYKYAAPAPDAKLAATLKSLLIESR